MPLQLNRLYYPLTAQPFSITPDYREMAPCAPLRPYICCFWGADAFHSPWEEERQVPGLVTPDTCMDVILSLNFSRNTVEDTFCGINDASFASFSAPTPDQTTTFAIRFYAWSVILFSDEDMGHSLNYHGESGAYFSRLKRDLFWLLMDTETLEDRAKITEKYLLGRIRPSMENADVMNALYAMISSKGGQDIRSIAEGLALSSRQLERIFKQQVGVSPKKMSDMIRYQLLWQEMISSPCMDMADAALKYGYFDQAHLINDFRKYHTMAPAEALKFAGRK